MLKLDVLLCSLVILMIIVLSNGQQNYCNICRDHTLCKPHYAKPNCAAKAYGLSKSQQQVILNEHNKYRQKVASGNERRGNPGPQPAAKYMPNLTWDNELANIAQALANSCQYGHDSCRNVQRFQVGQNLAKSWAVNSAPNGLEKLIQSWYDEVTLFNKNWVDNFKFRMDIGHYSQLVWAKTVKIGCGYVRYMNGNQDTVILVCNYGPSGNFPNQKVYERR